MGGDVVAGDATAWWDGAAIDSRKIAGGELFFALEGERTDGHRFVDAAFEAGAAAVVVHEDVSTEGGAVIRVSDTYRALHAQKVAIAMVFGHSEQERAVAAAEIDLERPLAGEDAALFLTAEIVVRHELVRLGRAAGSGRIHRSP
jgi:orotate phosphoribosyltransferase